MKTVTLASGLGTCLSEETALVPKPMIKIGAHPEWTVYLVGTELATVTAVRPPWKTRA